LGFLINSIFYLPESLRNNFKMLFLKIGIFNNLMNLALTRNKQKKQEFNENMYRFIELNSIFNVAYCTVMILKLLTTCIFDEAGIFCSSAYETKAGQYFNIIVIHFLGSALKLGSSISYLMFAFSRLVLIRFQLKQIALREKERKFKVTINLSFFVEITKHKEKLTLDFIYVLNKKNGF
jgi:hypothetical protein